MVHVVSPLSPSRSDESSWRSYGFPVTRVFFTKAPQLAFFPLPTSKSAWTSSCPSLNQCSDPPLLEEDSFYLQRKDALWEDLECSFPLYIRSVRFLSLFNFYSPPMRIATLRLNTFRGLGVGPLPRWVCYTRTLSLFLVPLLCPDI